MKLQTITTIELSSLCNLKCKYCINRLMVEKGRTPGIMSNEVFNLSLIWLDKLVKQGTQREVNLNGNGESLLDPNIVERIGRAKAVMGDLPVMFCTNGILITRELGIAMKDAGLDRLDVSVHDAFHARRCADILTNIGMNGTISDGAIKLSHNWAGQLEPENRVKIRYSIPCQPLILGMGYINSDGDLSPCCYDYQNLGKFGTVHDLDLLEKDIKPFRLCEECHQIIPEGFK